MNITPSVARVLFCISLAGITSTLLYLFLRKDEEELEEANEGIKTSRPATIEVKIPSDSVGVVIGRGGANIKEIQEKSDTKINFKDDNGNEKYRVCVIRGTPESAQLAESMIHEFISNQPLIEISEMMVPQKACGKIIGRNGDNIRSISRASGAKVTVESPSASKDARAERRVIIKGTSEQIELAKSLIKEKVDEDDDIEKSVSSRSPRKKDRQNFLMAAGDAQTNEPERHPSERLSATGSDGLVEVYVSAVHSPEKFWLQVISPRAVELDHLVEQMTDYYSKDENKEIHAIRELRLGHVVAAPFSYDDKWYRAEVTDIIEDEYDPQESKISLYYVDYGDSGDLKKKDIYELRTDFLRLRFQAIECCLAKVLPKGGKWSDEAIDLFEQLTHTAQWVVVMARVDSSKERERGHGKREGSPVPCVELFDPQRSEDISVAEELVKQDFAEWEKSENPTVPNGESAAASTSRSSEKNPTVPNGESAAASTSRSSEKNPTVSNGESVAASTSRSSESSVQGQGQRKLDGGNVKVDSPKIFNSENISVTLGAGGDISNHQVSGHLPKDESPTPQKKLIYGPDESDGENSDEMEMC